MIFVIFLIEKNTYHQRLLCNFGLSEFQNGIGNTNQLVTQVITQLPS